MKMPKNCFECNFAVDGLCVAMQSVRTRDWKAEETTNYCPLTEYETTDRIMLKAAVDGPSDWMKTAYADPDKPIIVKMTYGDLFVIVKMIEENRKKGKENVSFWSEY